MTLLNQSESSPAKTVQSRFLDGREYHADPKSAYVLAKDDIEKKRLREVRDSSSLHLSCTP